MKNLKMVAIIPARGGSKSIPLKNIKLINGKPLIYWSIDAAINCIYIDEVYVSTDNSYIYDAVNDYKLKNINNNNINKLKCISRSKETATDTASTESVMLEFAKEYDFNYIVLIQATSPLIKSTDLDQGIKKYFEDNYDSLLSVVRQKRFIWEEKDNCLVSPLNYNYLKRPRRQEFNGFLVENGAFYITDKNLLLENKCRISGNIGFYEMSEATYYEIDEIFDWNVVEYIMLRSEKLYASEALKNIKMVLSDCDGVLTDGGMYYSESGDELKKFNTRDGVAFELLRKNGLITGIITGEMSKLVQKRANKLKLDEIHIGIKEKINTINKLCDKYNINYSQIAYIGDDINDIEVLKKVGFSCCPQDAVREVKNNVNYVLQSKGGKGVIRELVNNILNL